MKKTAKDAVETPADDRVVTRTDNQPPELVGLLLAAEIPAHHAGRAKELLDEHLVTYLTVLRVPATIESQEVYDRVTTLGGLVKKAFDVIDKARTTAKAPYNAGGTAIDKVFALPVQIDDPEKEGEKKTIDLLPALKKAQTDLKGLLSAYDTKMYNEQQAKLDDETAALAESAAADGIELGATGAAVVMGSARSEHGGTAIRRVNKVFTIVDPSLVPASLCSPDPAKIQALLDAGATEIPGVSITNEVKTHVR